MSNLTATMEKAAESGHSAAVEFDTVVVVNEHVNAEYCLLELEAPAAAVARAEPGQFFHLLCPPVGERQPFFRRPMSIYRVEPDRRRLFFLYKVTGRGTRAMATLRPGDPFNLFGPLGIGFKLPPSGAPIVILARGVGLATLAPLVGYAHEAGHPVTGVLSARSPELLMAVDQMRADGAKVITVTDTQGTSSTEEVERLLRGLHAEGRMGAIYTCGSNRLLLLAQRLADELSLFGEVALEQQMACGLGMCFCCVRPFRQDEHMVHRRVCCEGPVFPLQEAVSW